MEPAARNGLDFAINCTVMAVREQLMEYFKGGGVQKYVDGVVRRERIGESHGRHYQRRRAQLKNEQAVYLHNSRILRLACNPQIITLDNITLNRSKSMKKVREGIEQFVAKYLRGVKIEVSDTGDEDNTIDKQIMEASRVIRMPQARQRRDRAEYGVNTIFTSSFDPLAAMSQEYVNILQGMQRPQIQPLSLPDDELELPF